MKPYVHSNYERKADDDYKTIDTRCVDALLNHIVLSDPIADCCAKNGSAIVDYLLSQEAYAFGMDDAFSSDLTAEWVVTNPPYDKREVNAILWRQIQRVAEKQIRGFAALMRNNFDFAKSRYDMFTHDLYYGQIHMMFRPWWSEEKKQSPIHNFVWHIWRNDDVLDFPIVMYWKES